MLDKIMSGFFISFDISFENDFRNRFVDMNAAVL
jgi:hypothetical protein